jgi:hypothetical protein
MEGSYPSYSFETNAMAVQRNAAVNGDAPVDILEQSLSSEAVLLY